MLETLPEDAACKAQAGCYRMQICAQAFKLFQMMWRERITPNVATYRAVLSVCGSEQVEKSFPHSQLMQCAKLMLDVFTYSIVFSACGKGKKAKQALEFFEVMLRRCMVPAEMSYTGMISDCKKHRKPDRSLELVEGTR